MGHAVGQLGRRAAGREHVPVGEAAAAPRALEERPVDPQARLLVEVLENVGEVIPREATVLRTFLGVDQNR